jgi:uncharacterized surface protein with fasciclin (FAS1) repeats
MQYNALRHTFHANALALALATALAGFAGTGTAFAANPMVGGAAMFETKNIVQNAMNSKDHTTLVAAVKHAGLVDTLSGKGPFTVFAPTNAAFDALPAGTLDSLMKPDMKDKLTKVLTAHVVAGKITGADLANKAKAMNGMVTLKTVSGDDLTVKLDGMNLWIVDENGNQARITIADVEQSNGVIHVVDKVLLPK